MSDVVALTLVAAATILLGVFAIRSGVPDRAMFLVLLATNSYYAILGPIYWLEIHQGYFLGVSWAEQIPSAAATLSVCVVFWGWLISTTSRRARRSWMRTAAGSQLEGPRDLPRFWWFFFSLGLLGAAYTLFNALVLGRTYESKDPFFLIAYQFADMLIPPVLYAVAMQRSSKSRLLIICAFCAYLFIVGFRYKFALFLGPIVLWTYLKSYGQASTQIGRLFVSAKLAFFGLAVVAAFAVSTLIRRPFEGAEFGVLRGAQSDDFLYGAFAESNTIFAFAAILESFVPKGVYYYAQPIIDALAELIPRVLWPSRQTGKYITDVLANLIAPEAIFSGTAYPYAGELLLMGGFTGVLVLTPLIAWWYVRCRTSLLVKSRTLSTCLMGLGLLAVYFGYYYYSRGYFSQAFKGFLFVVFPYLVMVRGERVTRVVSSMK